MTKMNKSPKNVKKPVDLKTVLNRTLIAETPIRTQLIRHMETG